MAMQIAVGSSASLDSKQAAREAVRSALQSATHPAFALVLSTDQYDADDLAAALSQELGPVPWAGCCTAGVFVGTQLLQQGLVIGVVQGPDVRVGVGMAGLVSEDGRAAGALAAQRALAQLPGAPPQGWSRALLVLPDAVTGNGADVVRGAVQVGGTGAIWAGGGAGDNLRFVRTAQFADGKAYSDSAVVVAIDSPVRIAAGIRHGFKPYGPATMVTRASGSAVSELEYEQAFSVYQRTAEGRGDQVSRDQFATFAMTHPLGIPQADGEHVIRDPLRVDGHGSLHCVGEVPDGCLVRVMEGDRACILGAARDAARSARQAVGGTVGGAIVFDCISRSLMLGEGVREELATFGAELGEGVPVVGCLTFGEVGALGRGVPQFHNKTAVVLALGA